MGVRWKSASSEVVVVAWTQNLLLPFLLMIDGEAD